MTDETKTQDSTGSDLSRCYAAHLIECAWKADSGMFRVAAEQGCDPKDFAEGLARICELGGNTKALAELRSGRADKFIAAKFGYA